VTLLFYSLQVAEQIALSPEQQAAISAAFEVYATARRPVVQQVHQLAGQLHAQLGLLCADQGGWAPGVYDLSTAKEADGLLQQMSRCTKQLRELSRRLVW
jgi:hypothetical protein